MSTIIPVGTTHIIPSGSSYLALSDEFFKWDYTFTGPESGTRYYGWYYWSGAKWIKDTTFCDRIKTMIPIEQHLRNLK